MKYAQPGAPRSTAIPCHGVSKNVQPMGEVDGCCWEGWYLKRSHCMAAQSMDRQVDLSCSTALLVSAMPLCVPAMAAAAAASSISDST